MPFSPLRRKNASGLSPTTDYSQTIPDAYKRYMDLIYGQGSGQGPQGYVQNQTRGFANTMQPYYSAMSGQSAAGLGARGGLGGGSQDWMNAYLKGQQATGIQNATMNAQQQVANTGQNMIGAGQREGFQLTQDELQRFMANLEEKKFKWDTGFGGIMSDVIGAGGMIAGGLPWDRIFPPKKKG